ncbi:hypothetical protein D9M69_525670 [compost metagenome]
MSQRVVIACSFQAAEGQQELCIDRVVAQLLVMRGAQYADIRVEPRFDRNLVTITVNRAPLRMLQVKQTDIAAGWKRSGVFAGVHIDGLGVARQNRQHEAGTDR